MPLRNDAVVSGVAAEEGDQSGLHIGVAGYLDLRTVMPALAKCVVDFVDPVEHASNLSVVERFIEAGGAGEVPSVDEDVGEDEGHHCFVEPMAPSHRVIECQSGLLAV